MAHTSSSSLYWARRSGKEPAWRGEGDLNLLTLLAYQIQGGRRLGLRPIWKFLSGENHVAVALQTKTDSRTSLSLCTDSLS